MMEEKFYDLAFKKLSGKASGEELRELDELLTQDSSLQEKYDQLAKELPALKELMPLVKEPGSSSDELPEFEKNQLMNEVRDTFGTKESSATDNQKEGESFGVWGWVLGLGITTALIVFLLLPRTDPTGPGNGAIKKARAQTVEVEFAMRVSGDVRGSDKDPSKNVKKHWKKSPVKTFEETEDLEEWWDKDWPKTEADLQVKVLKLTETLIIKGRNNQVESGVKYEFNEVTGKIEITLPETEEFAFDGKKMIFSKKIEATLKGGVLSGIKGIKAKDGLTARVKKIRLEAGDIVIETFWVTKRFKLEDFEKTISGVKDENLESQFQETIEQLKEKPRND